ncbi:MAG: sulfatase-like hydrolase/transferase [Marinilabiliaceae bacterium]|nr:sulfatase-like hydrolase/transferase [Marinilabiliaceae bacterium]
MKNAWKIIWLAVRYLISIFIFWILTFTAQRIFHIILNSDKAIDTPSLLILEAFGRGLIFDVSIAAYFGILFCALALILSIFTKIRPAMITTNILIAVGSSIVVALLPANAIVYSYWGRHFDATDLDMIADNPSLAFASSENWTIALYLFVAIILIICNILLLLRLTKSIISAKEEKSKGWIAITVQTLGIALLASALIIPIRGGVGIAPLNTGRAFFSNSLFANHVALNPAWNFLYSLKRAKQANTTYHFMDDDDAKAKFEILMERAHDNDGLQILNCERPNIVIILLESFSAHAVEYLGGENVTPSIKNLLPESIAFSNIMASSDRSGKGLVGVMCGYPVLPTYSIIQYPQKTQSLPFIAHKLRNVGYHNQTFLYGGDLGFNNFNSLVNLAGFDNIITQDDFSQETMSDKWGAHDEHLFQRLIEEIDNQPQPFFNFLFTLSSHEPFTVPMETKHDHPYMNSVCYTDSCLGAFFKEAKSKKWWNNTLFILVSDHGHGGPQNVDYSHKSRFNIPLVLTGGALAVKDTIISHIGSQIDIASTLLSQLQIDNSEFIFSKNILSPNSPEFAFYDFNDGYGYVDKNNFQVFDNQAKKYLTKEFYPDDSQSATRDTITAKVILQNMSIDCTHLGN